MSANHSLAPIAFFGFRRPEHMAASLASLRNCELADQSELFIYCDGARKKEDEALVAQVREVAQQQTWARQLTVVAQEKNIGLAASIVQGASDLCARFGRVIVLEDDLIVGTKFLQFMNQALDFYQDDERVFQVSAHNFDVPEFRNQDDALLMPMITSWGWATWQRAWRQYSSDMSVWKDLRKDRTLIRRLNLNQHYDYDIMLDLAAEGQIDSWAIRWYLTLFQKKGLTVYPPRTLIQNFGHDGSGTHGKQSLKSAAIGGAHPLAELLRWDFPTTPASESQQDAMYRAIGNTQRPWVRWARRLVHRIRNRSN